MTPRQKELIWAFGVILVAVAIVGGMLHPESDAWFLFFAAVCGPAFLYLGLRWLFDKKYRERSNERALEMAARHDKNFDVEKQRGYSKHPLNQWSGHVFAMRGAFLGLILLLILIGAIADRFLSG